MEFLVFYASETVTKSLLCNSTIWWNYFWITA